MDRTAVVVGFDDSRSSIAALDWAADAARRLDAELAVVWVQPTVAAWGFAAVQIDPEKRRQQMIHRLVQVCDEHLGRSDTTYHARVVEGVPARVLRHEGAAPGARLLVIGASHRGAIGDLVMGSVAHDLIHDAPVPVVVVPELGDSGGE